MIDTQINPRKFMLIESLQIPLNEISFDTVKNFIIDPITNKPYQGMILEGCFVDLSNDGPNNNKRFYDIPSYLELIKILRKQIFSPKGVYGQYEHPEGYAVDGKKVSHKIIDIWWDESQKKVFGRVLLLNEGDGLLAQAVIRSGGQLGISARAAGEEKKRADGSFDCKVKLLVTFDLVQHPGFSSAVLNFKELNESQKFIQSVSENKKGFSGIIYDEDISSIQTQFKQYLSLNENKQYCFYEWYFKNLSESEKVSKEEKLKDKAEEDKLEDNTPSDEDKIQNNLKKEAEKELKESYFKQVKQSEIDIVMKNNKLSKSFYQGAAGFVNDSNI